jgi:prepilin-type processing-associated H-X9-DG protein
LEGSLPTLREKWNRDMIAMGDATLVWVPPILLKALYNITAPASYSGGALIDINSHINHLSAKWPGREGILKATKHRHGGTYNVIFCDGHVENIKEERLFEKTERALRRWNSDNEPHADLLQEL